MKKKYEKPVAEKIEFDYRNQVVASNSCWYSNAADWSHGTSGCQENYNSQFEVHHPA